MDSINKLSAADHHLMMEKLEIKSLRPGPSGNPKDSNAANSDEAEVVDYELPALLAFSNGRRVTSREQWKERREEILENFNSEMYGRLPEKLPGVEWKTVSEKDTLVGKYPVKVTELLGVVDNSAYPAIQVNIEMTLTTPLNAENAVPVILKFDWNWPAGFLPKDPKPNPWQEQLLAQNWGYASLIPTSFQADNGAGLREGIIGLVNKGEPRKTDDLGNAPRLGMGCGQSDGLF